MGRLNRESLTHPRSIEKTSQRKKKKRETVTLTSAHEHMENICEKKELCEWEKASNSGKPFL